MTCGVPVISTKVGIVPEVFGNRQSSFILGERTPEALAEKLLLLHRNRPLLYQLSQENLKQIEEWSWKKKASAFSSFFEQILKKKSLKNKKLN